MTEVDHVSWQWKLLHHHVGDYRDLHVGESDHVDHVLFAAGTFSVDNDDDDDDFVFVNDIEEVGDVYCIDAVYGDDDICHLVVGEWIPGKQLRLLSSIRPDQSHCYHFEQEDVDSLLFQTY